MNVLQAVRWAVEAWHQDVKPLTIYNCFMKSTVRIIGPMTEADAKGIATVSTDLRSIEKDVGGYITQLVNRQAIKEAMDVHRFLNPVEERITDPIEDIEAHIISTLQDGRDVESDEELIADRNISFTEVADAIELLRTFEMSQTDGDPELVSRLTKLERETERRKRIAIANKPQRRIDDFFTM
jgi:hypothetical protein